MSGLFDPDRSAERLPVSLITGFLGSGKTTLLNRLVQRPEMADSAVIINEFGEIALDHLLVAPVAGEAVVLASGCLCCAVRGDLQETLRGLLIERDRGSVPPFARVLIETSGLADPAPVVQLFLNNPLLGHYLRLDAVIATIDAVNGGRALVEHWEARKQAALADRLLVTKTDIASPAKTERLTLALRALNPATVTHRVVHGKIDPKAMFGVGPFDSIARVAAASDEKGHLHDHAVDSFCLQAEAPLDWGRFHDWLGRLRAEHGERLLRVKGVLNIAGEDGPVAVHGVHHTFHPPVALACWPNADRRSQIVFITSGIERSAVEPGWLAISRGER
jgi:G3E family GTPase